MNVDEILTETWWNEEGTEEFLGSICVKGVGLPRRERGADTSKSFVRLEMLLPPRQWFTGRGSYLGSPTAPMGALVLV